MLYSASVEELAKPVKEEKVEQETSPPATETEEKVEEKVEEPVKEKKKRVRKPKEIKEEPQEIPKEKKKRVSKKTLDEQIEDKKKEIEKVKSVLTQKTKGKKEVDEPPVWFKSFIKNMKSQENLVAKEKKSKKKIGVEVEEEATKQWNDDHTRDRITSQANNHLNQMQKLYHQMFRR